MELVLLLSSYYLFRLFYKSQVCKLFCQSVYHRENEYGFHQSSVDRNMIYADGAIKLAKPLVSPLAISYTLLEKRE